MFIKKLIKRYKINKAIKKTGFGLIGKSPIDGRDFLASTILAKDVELPEQFVVSRYRHWFDDNFNIIPEVVKREIKNQFGRGSCVSQAYTRQKEAQEKVALSARHNHAHCKAVDNLPGEGTFLRTAQMVGVNVGVAEEKLYPEPGREMSYGEYIRLDLIPGNVEENAKKHKAQSCFSVYGWDQYSQMIFQHDIPIHTGCIWSKKDNYIDDNGIFPVVGDTSVGGHSFVLIGWKVINGVKHKIIINSWGTVWADNGIGYMSEEAFSRIFEGWVTVDIENNLAKLLQKIDGKNVKLENSPNLYHISGGEKHLYEDELVWWSHNNSFEGEIITITQDEFDLIPDGKKIEFDWSHNWEPVQIKELLGFIGNDSARVQELYKKYF